MILVGDNLLRLREIEEGSVQTCITSPPYFGLRDYGAPGQHGLEPTPEEFIDVMVRVFREVRRVLRNDGTLWLNIGDSYAGAGGQSVQTGPLFKGRRRQRQRVCISSRVTSEGLKPKDLVGVPWMLAFALRADGWWLRQDIIWAKPNPMPESVSDRCTKAHEYLFLLSKSSRYYFDAEAIAEPRASVGGRAIAGWAAGPGNHSVVAHNRDKGNAKTFRGGQYTNNAKFDNSHYTERSSTGNAPPEKDTRNKRSVWDIATQPCKEAHFATFPEALVEPCILAGSRPGDLVLDPYLGSGTTAMVAQRLGRRWIGCELNLDYAVMADRRIHNTHPGLAL